eukprot:TRINITY_DN4118_c0_g1_i2.p1 TRINITY_DN4118_c0_g1~~TRINITY_DN4118_c0_g1_i2.p1  ORF type:complete len:112 (-),score=13.10 TRINITY_DN4118_c0_g1_i2:304-639(-)
METKKDKKRFDDDYQKPEFIEVQVSDPETISDENGKPQYTTYKIEVDTNFPQYSSNSFTVRRRYNDFVWLRNHLKKKMEEKGKRLTIADLPGDTLSSWFGPGINRLNKVFV